MSASTTQASDEWDELPTDGGQAWVGVLLVVGSSFVSLRVLGWVAKAVGGIVMQ